MKAVSRTLGPGHHAALVFDTHPVLVQPQEVVGTDVHHADSGGQVEPRGEAPFGIEHGQHGAPVTWGPVLLDEQKAGLVGRDRVPQGVRLPGRKWMSVIVTVPVLIYLRLTVPSS